MDLIIGDNPFFGVNHKHGSRPLDEEWNRFGNAATVVAKASENHFSTFMLSAHPGYQNLLLKVDSALSILMSKISLALVIPYPHTLNKIVAEGGYLALINTVGYSSLLRIIYEIIVLRYYTNVVSLKSSFKKAMQIELDTIECKYIYPEYICLHNVVTDILLATGRIDVMNGFAAACRDLKLTPVFISQNPISLVHSKIIGPHICCFTYNAAGYMVNPSLKAVQDGLKGYAKEKKLWAMQILASGALNLEEAITSELLDIFQGLVYATTKEDRVIEFSDKIKTYSERGQLQ